MPAGKGETFRANTFTRCLIIVSGSRWAHEAFQSSYHSLHERVETRVTGKNVGDGSEKWLFFPQGGEKTLLLRTNKKEKEERNFTSERFHFVNMMY